MCSLLLVHAMYPPHVDQICILCTSSELHRFYSFGIVLILKDDSPLRRQTRERTNRLLTAIFGNVSGFFDYSWGASAWLVGEAQQRPLPKVWGNSKLVRY